MKLFNTYQEFIANPWVIVLFGLISGVGYVLDLFLVEFTSAIVVMHSVCAGISFTTLVYFLITKKHNWELLKILTLILFLNLLVLPFLALTLDNFILLFLRNALFYWATMAVVALLFGTRQLMYSALLFGVQFVLITILSSHEFLQESFITIAIVFSIYVLIIYAFITQIESFLTEQERVKNELENQSQLLSKSNNTKGKLLSIIGHDLRSPLMSLTSLSVLIKDEVDQSKNEDLKDYAGLLSTTVEQTSFLVNNLLEWSRSQENNITLSVRPIRIEPFLLSLKDLVEFKLTSKNIAFNIGSLTAPEIFADQNALQTILRNLVTNAIKFTNPGGEITISSHSDALGCFITIKDNGVGMDKDTLRALQDISSYASKKGTAEERGTGIGFNLCIELMHLHNGYINIESEPKKGTKIILFFPDKNTD
jgi:signal transduction histidine kinase